MAAQQADLDSLLYFTKKLLALPKEFPALRQSEGLSVLVGMNFSRPKVKFNIPNGKWRLLLSNRKGSVGELAVHEIQVLALE